MAERSLGVEICEGHNRRKLLALTELTSDVVRQKIMIPSKLCNMLKE